MLETAWKLLEDSAAFLLVGFVLAGVFEAILGGRALPAILQRRGALPVFLTTLIGAPLPLCSCSVLPAALALRRRGASAGATVSFLVSTPETGVTSILMSFGLLGPVLAIVRPIAACVTAISAGLLTNLWEERAKAAPTLPHAPGATVAPAAEHGCSHECCETTHAAEPSGWLARVRRGLRFAFVDLFDDIFGWVLIGIAAAAALQHWVPADVVTRLGGGGIGTMLLLAAIAVPLYVCAEASTPIAAAMIASGVSPGAALVFLLTGPATNLGSIGVLRREIGSSLVGIYLVSIIAIAIGSGLLFDTWLDRGEIGGLSSPVGPELPHGIQIAAAIVFLALGIGWLRRRKPIARLMYVGKDLLGRVRGPALEEAHKKREQNPR